MVAKTESGFTIIEVILFLAITGVLFAALMIGVGSAVTQQRYLDSVDSFKALAQQEYSEAINTDNQISGADFGCTTSGATTGTRDARGASDCVLLGRAITIDGTTVATASVTARDRREDELEGKGDIAALAFYEPQLSDNGRVVSDVAWGSRLATSGGSLASLRAVILILRSPISGTVHTFVRHYNATDVLPRGSVMSLISTTTARTELRACVDGDSGSMPKQLVKINPAIAGPDAVTIEVDVAGCSL